MNIVPNEDLFGPAAYRVENDIGILYSWDADGKKSYTTTPEYDNAVQQLRMYDIWKRHA